ncbi:MAG: alpha-isopropylmalate synthase regulatory domain-containing protein, partial [Cyanobacteria bacterium P01_D01_bin.44]
GIAFLLEQYYGITLPRRMQVEFSSVVQRVMDAGGQELSAEAIWQIFDQTYLRPVGPIDYQGHRLTLAGDDNQVQRIEADIVLNGQPLVISGAGNGPIDALVNGLAQALDLEIQVQHYEEKALEQGSWASAIALLELTTLDHTCHGVGIHENIVTASLLAVISAVNRAQVEVKVAGLQRIR